MNFIKKLIYNYLYKSSGEQVMGALTNTQAYEIYKKTNEAKILLKEKKIKNIQNNMKDLESCINYDIKEAMNDGKYKSKTESYKIRLNREQKKYLKKQFENQGFKIRIGYKKHEDYFKLIDIIKISWKHYQ